MTTFNELYARELAHRGFHADPAQRAAVDALDDLRERLIERESLGSARHWLARLRGRESVRGLYLWGDVGRGKTYLMDLFFESLPFAQRQRRHFHRFMYDVHARLAELAQTSAPLEEIAKGVAREAHVLCLDELFVSDIADAMIVGGLLNALFRRGVALVATSNLPPARLYENGLQRERFLPAIALLEAPHARARGGCWHRLSPCAISPPQASTLQAATPTRRRSSQRFSGRSPRAAKPHAGTRCTSRGGAIDGRALRLATAVWFESAALCAGARSQNDYIEIARTYQTVFLANVPQLDAEHDNEARRFIALVDEFYDRSVKLIVSAAAPPAQLYRGERLVLDFARAASRLVEMQSEEYLAREHRS